MSLLKVLGDAFGVTAVRDVRRRRKSDSRPMPLPQPEPVEAVLPPPQGARWRQMPDGAWQRWSYLGGEWEDPEEPPRSLALTAAGPLAGLMPAELGQPVIWAAGEDEVWTRTSDDPADLEAGTSSQPATGAAAAAATDATPTRLVAGSVADGLAGFEARLHQDEPDLLPEPPPPRRGPDHLGIAVLAGAAVANVGYGLVWLASAGLSRLSRAFVPGVMDEPIATVPITSTNFVLITIVGMVFAAMRERMRRR